MAKDCNRSVPHNAPQYKGIKAILPEEWTVESKYTQVINKDINEIKKGAANYNVQLRPEKTIFGTQKYVLFYGRHDDLKNYLSTLNVEIDSVTLKKKAFLAKQTNTKWYTVVEGVEVTYDDEINNVIAYAFENKYRYATWHLDEASVRVYFEKNLMSETIFNGDQFVSKRQVFRQDPKTAALQNSNQVDQNQTDINSAKTKNMVVQNQNIPKDAHIDKHINNKSKPIANSQFYEPNKERENLSKLQHHQRSDNLPPKENEVLKSYNFTGNSANTAIPNKLNSPKKIDKQLVSQMNEHDQNLLQKQHATAIKIKENKLNECNETNYFTKKQINSNAISSTDHIETDQMDSNENSDLKYDFTFNYSRTNTFGSPERITTELSDLHEAKLPTEHKAAIANADDVKNQYEMRLLISSQHSQGNKIPDVNNLHAYHHKESNESNFQHFVNYSKINSSEDQEKPRPSAIRQRSTDNTISVENDMPYSHHVNVIESNLPSGETLKNDDIQTHLLGLNTPLHDIDKQLTNTMSQCLTSGNMIATIKKQSPTDHKYQDIRDAFYSSISKESIEIVEINRIFNSSLYKEYEAHKEKLIARNPLNFKNERYLWHGTGVKQTPFGLMPLVRINDSGFNRGYCGKSNGAVYGDGVYFATTAQMAAKYAIPHTDGNRYMYYCRVLTGEFTQGINGLKEPPVKNMDKKGVWYDSVVDNINSPLIFVIFRDTQAYPEYLITFK